MPAVERLLVLGRARRAIVPRRHDGGVGEVAEVLRPQVSARRAEGHGRSTKQLGCVRYDGVVTLTSPAWLEPACPANSETKSGTLGALQSGASDVARVCAAPRAARVARTHAATTLL